MEELARYKKALEIARHSIGLLLHSRTQDQANHIAAETNRDIDAALNPPPEFEDVAIERYVVFSKDGIEQWHGHGSNPGIVEGEQIVKLTGTYQRPRPRAVEKRVLLDKTPGDRWYTDSRGYTVKIPTDRDVYATWSEVEGK